MLLLVARPALKRIGRGDSGYHLVEYRADGIDIRVRSLVAAAAVLLLRRVAGLDYDGKAAAVGRCCEARRAEVDKLGLSVLCQEYIVRADITVKYSRLMDMVERLYDGHHYLNRLVSRYGLFSLESVGKRLAVEIFHDYICGSVRLEAVKNLDDSALVLEFRKALRLVDKLRHSVVELTLFFARENRYASLSLGAGGEFTREILLYRHLYAQDGIPRNICNAEAAVSQHPTYLVTSVENRTRGHMERAVRRCVRRISAVRAELPFLVVELHAPHAAALVRILRAAFVPVFSREHRNRLIVAHK